MNIRNSKISEADAHQELVLMDSRVAAIMDESYSDRFRRMDLPYSGLLTRFRDLLSETRWCGGHMIHLGKIVCNEILEFMESDPQVPSGMLLESAVKALGRSIPFLGMMLAPISAEVECQGFSRLLATPGFSEKLDDRARVFFRRFSEVLNANQKLLRDPDEKGMDGVTFEEPALFELDDSENPFDLDDLNALSPAAAATAKFLIKLAAADKHLGETEKKFVSQTVGHMGESLSQSQYDRLVSEASHESLERILNTVSDEAVSFREKLLLLAMLLSAADGRVDTIEKKLLAQALPFLGISKQRYSEIARDALALIKARRQSLGEGPKAVTQSAASLPPVQAAPAPSPRNAGAAESAVRGANHSPAIATEPAKTNEQPDPPPQPAQQVAERPTPSDAPVRNVSTQRAEPPTPERKIWRCPACRMPQFSEFEECPQCGVIVSKFRQKLARKLQDSDEDYMVEVPSEPMEDVAPPPDSQPSSETESDAPVRCAGCQTTLPVGAKFCPSCGTRAG